MKKIRKGWIQASEIEKKIKHYTHYLNTKMI